MPVGTRGAVKAVTQRDLEDLGAEIILGNTYHLYLKPGDGLIARCGGLHRFIGWDRPILTDSGGYQVFSLAAMRRIREEGAEFRSHIDGSLHMLTPERAADIQAQLGSDIAMVLDECVASPAGTRTGARGDGAIGAVGAAGARPPPPAPPRSGVRAGRARHQSRAGAVRDHPGRHRPRRCGPKACRRPSSSAFEAYAIGGLSVGEPVDVMYEVVAHTAPQLPDDRPRYLMGTGMPDDLFECVAHGDRHVRLRAPDPQRPERPAPHAPRPARHQERAVRRGCVAARSRTAAATPAGIFPGPICGTFSSPER